MNMLTICQGRRTGKTMLVVGAVDRYLKEFGPNGAVIIYRKQEFAHDARRRWNIPYEAIAWAKMPQDDLWAKIAVAMLIVIEDNDTWTSEEHSAVGCLVTKRRDLHRTNNVKLAPTLITTINLPEF